MLSNPDGLIMIILQYAAIFLEVLGAAVICAGVLITTCLFLYRSWMHGHVHRFYQKYRRGMGKAILLGLEILIAGDIIKTTTYGFEMEHLMVLGLLVLIRTFLSFALEVEINGHLPWKRLPDEEME